MVGGKAGARWKMIYRTSKQADLKTIQELDAVFFAGCVPPGGNIVWWIAKEIDESVGYAKVAGYAGARIVDGEIYLERAAVCKWARGQGLQKKLIRARLRYGRAQRCTHAVTYTINNPASANSLISCGFRAYTPAYPWVDGDDVSYWRLKL